MAAWVMARLGETSWLLAFSCQSQVLFVPMLLIGSYIGQLMGLVCGVIAASGGHGLPGKLC